MKKKNAHGFETVGLFRHKENHDTETFQNYRHRPKARLEAISAIPQYLNQKRRGQSPRAEFGAYPLILDGDPLSGTP